MKILIERADGGVSVTPVSDAVSADEEVAKWKTLFDVPGSPAYYGYVSHQIVADNLAPSDKTFREAWKIKGNAVEIDMPKAREIHKDRLRELRVPLLAAADVEFMRAFEVGDQEKLAKIAASKQVLRDVTEDPAIDRAKTPEELKKVIPKALK